MAGILCRFQMSDQITSPRESLLTEGCNSPQVTKYRIPDIHSGRGKVRFVEGTLQKSTGGQDHIPCAGAQAQSEYTHNQDSIAQIAIHTSPLSHAPSSIFGVDGRTQSPSDKPDSAHLITTLFRGQLAEFGHQWLNSTTTVFIGERLARKRIWEIFLAGFQRPPRYGGRGD